MSSDNNSRDLSYPPIPSLILSSNLEEDVWNYIEQLTNMEFTSYLLEERVKTDFYGFGDYFERINRKKDYTVARMHQD